MNDTPAPIEPDAVDHTAARRALLVSDDLLPSLIKHFDQPTLARAMRVNTSFNKLAGPRLYRTVVFDYSRSFVDSPGSGVLDDTPSLAKGGAPAPSFEYSKAYHLAKNTVILEIINHPGEIQHQWHNRILNLRRLCPRLEVIRFKGHVTDFQYAYQAAFYDYSAADWKPLVVEFVADANAIAVHKHNLPKIVFANLAHAECHVQIDAFEMALADEILSVISGILGIQPDWLPAPLPGDHKMCIDFVRGFGPRAALGDYVAKLALLFFWTRVTLSVTFYVNEVTEKDEELAERAKRSFKRRVEGHEGYLEAYHRERLAGCSFRAASACEIGQYACLKSVGIDHRSTFCNAELASVALVRGVMDMM